MINRLGTTVNNVGTSTLIVISMAASEYSLWGWERFFEELETFLTTANREIGSTSPEYAQFVLERLGTCVHALPAVCDRLEGELDSEVVEIRETLVGVRGCCRSLWQSYIDHLDSNSTIVSWAQMVTGYQAPVMRHGVAVPSSSSHKTS